MFLLSKHAIKVPSHILTRRSPEFQKNLRAKTVRIGKIRWPPPLNAEEIDSANQHRCNLFILKRNIFYFIDLYPDDCSFNVAFKKKSTALNQLQANQIRQIILTTSTMILLPYFQIKINVL